MGETQSLFRRGLHPRHPCTKPFAALACLCLSDTPRGGVPPAALARPAGAVPGGRCAPAALARPAPGERTISNAEVPLPRSPLSLAAGTAHREPLPVGFAANRRLLARGARMAEAVSAANGLMQGCRGRSPRRNKVKISPFPPGRGAGGMGARNKANGRVGRRPKTPSPPADTTAARSAGDQPDKPPQRAPASQVQPV